MHQPDLQGGAGAVHIELGPKEVFLVFRKIMGAPETKIVQKFHGDNYWDTRSLHETCE